MDIFESFEVSLLNSVRNHLRHGPNLMPIRILCFSRIVPSICSGVVRPKNQIDFVSKKHVSRTFWRFPSHVSLGFRTVTFWGPREYNNYSPNQAFRAEVPTLKIVPFELFARGGAKKQNSGEKMKYAPIKSARRRCPVVFFSFFADIPTNDMTYDSAESVVVSHCSTTHFFIRNGQQNP